MLHHIYGIVTFHADFCSFLCIFPFCNFLCLQTNCAVYLQPKHDIKEFSCHNRKLETDSVVPKSRFKVVRIIAILDFLANHRTDSNMRYIVLLASRLLVS